MEEKKNSEVQETEETFIPDCCRHKSRERSEKEYKDLLNRLNRIEGQVRGVRRMLENNAYCPDIITQVSAINAALNSFNKVILADHIQTCVADDIKAGGTQKVEELVKLLQKVMK
ncbi:MAG: metal-sensing transcriptional repressor [Lachnospiraceae bacterium]|jgi:DNA-binding FrmR family transcriptional regulator